MKVNKSSQKAQKASQAEPQLPAGPAAALPDTQDWDPAAAPTFWINHASRLLMRQFEQQLRPLEFGMAYLPVAMMLHEQGPLLQKALAERAQVEQPTMAALLTRMERDGLIARGPHPHDKRASLISLTPKAESRLPAAMALMGAVAARATTGLGPEEKALLLGLLQRIVANLESAD